MASLLNSPRLPLAEEPVPGFSQTPSDADLSQAQRPVPRLLVEVLGELERQQVRYCLLGSPEQLKPESRCQEVDLLLDPEDLARAESAFAQYGFHQIPAWGNAPHHFYVAFVPEMDLWIKLDIVTGLSFGDPVRALRLDFAHHFLQHRRRVRGTFLLAPGDALLLILLKLLLQRYSNQRRAKRLEVLWNLYQEVRRDSRQVSRLDQQVKRWLEPALPADILWESLAHRSWVELEKRRKSVFRQLLSGQPVAALGRLGWGLLARRMRPFLYLTRRSGLWIALMAPDGGGKTTLARAICKEPYLRARYIYLGAYGNAGRPRWLRQLEGGGWIASCLASAARLARHQTRLAKARWYDWCGHVVVFDRFYYEARLNKRRSKGSLTWLRRPLLESRRTPDMTLLLDAPGQVLFARKGEHSAETLEQQRQAFLQLSRELPITVLDATLSLEQLRRQIVGLIWGRYGQSNLKA